MSGKMRGFVSINTTTNSAVCNRYKMKYDICKRCYASRFLSMRPHAERRFRKNLDTLKSGIIPDEYLPRFMPSEIIRFHSYGELANENHARNFFNIADASPKTVFTIWTKRYKLIQKVIEKIGKPANLILIYSNPSIDTSSVLPKYFDKTFNVKSKKSTAEIHCGKRKCIECMKCYILGDGTTVINEKLK